MKTVKAKKEDPAIAAQHCLEGLPYRMIVFSRLDGNRTPLYLIAGSNDSEMGAEKALRTAHARHGGACLYCKKPIKKGEATVDHVEPEKLGGGDALQNLVISCKPCNATKGHKPIEAFNPAAGREWLSALLNQVQQRLNRIK